MATFSAVNADPSPLVNRQDGQEQNPTTPRLGTNTAEDIAIDGQPDESSATTPTRHSFAGIPGQKPLPDEPFTPSNARNEEHDIDSPLPNGDDVHPSPSPADEPQDIEMGDADDLDDGVEEDGSDNESVMSESQRPSKKKKGQRFFCTDYPPCQLSFTRSEHLARHIRKHTGERPFQCHCSRRFSRLDNLRQHAQTVHVNEEIPGDSLAATSTRFQRQIRTDRVRPPNSRSRASTMGSQGGHSRGHSRNLSASSIASTASSIGMPEEIRRRPQPLAMASDGSGRSRASNDAFNGIPGTSSQQNAYYNQSPTGYSTPVSTTFSTGTGSPRYQSGMTSPVSTISRSSFYGGAQSSGRRLSVPSENNLYQGQATYPPGYFGSIPPVPPIPQSHTSTAFGSPTSSVYSHSRRESESEAEYRRRTWHPGSSSQYAQRPATSGLSYYQTPDQPRPAFSQQAVTASQMTRLPGIESFDHAPPSSAARQQPSPMMSDASPRPPSAARPSDTGLQQGLNRLEITPTNPQSDGRWQANQGVPPPSMYYPQQAPAPPAQYVHPQHISMPEPPMTPRRNKRNAWYGGPLAPSSGTQGGLSVNRTSPEDSGSSDGVPTPSTSQGNEYHPVIMNSHQMADSLPTSAVMTEEQKAYYNAVQPKPDPVRTDSGYQSFTASHIPPPQTYALQSAHDNRFVQTTYNPPQGNDMTKLEALVAVATSEGNRAVEHRT